MGAARPEYKTDELARANERILRLERRITDQGVLLLKQASHLKQANRTQNELRDQLANANANAARFHALLLAERIRKVVAADA
jgi:hypothetical protein